MSPIKNYFAMTISKLSPKLFFYIAYFHNRKRFPNLHSPKDLSEIWIKHLLSGEVNKYAYLADKYAVRKFITEKGYQDILVPLIGVWNNENEIPFEDLPQKFALKMNFGAGMNIICTNKNKLNIAEAKNKIRKWFSLKVYNFSERHYNLIPKKIICETFIEDKQGIFPFDYKFMCINGKPFCILACGLRESGHAEYSPYSLDWEPLYHYKKGGTFKKVDKPKNLGKMIQIATELSKNLELVRIDLYDTGDKIIFGEITLTPAGCIFHRWTQQAITEMGKFYNNTKYNL